MSNASVINALDVNQFHQEIDANVSLEGPKRIGYFSCHENDDGAVYTENASALRYLDLPSSSSIDCLAGYDPKLKYGHVMAGDMLLLRWVFNNESTIQDFPSDFVCNNGVLKDLMTIENTICDFVFSATKIRGRIVLKKIESIEQKERVNNQSDYNNKSTYASFNLPGLMTKKSNDHDDIRGTIVDSFYCVSHSKIGSHRILHAGWLHCLESRQELSKPFDNMKFIMIKKFNSPRPNHSYFQAKIWWSLARLCGVDKIVRVKCHQDFTVKNIDELEVNKLIDEQSQKNLVIVLNTILDHIKSVVTEENKCYNFHFNSKLKKLLDLNVNKSR